MKDAVEQIMRRRRHQGHSGGLDGCPLCDRSAAPKEEEMLDEDFLSDDQALLTETTPVTEQSPVRARLDSIFGKKQ